jgi:hypothetical protein
MTLLLIRHFLLLVTLSEPVTSTTLSTTDSTGPRSASKGRHRLS